MVDDPSSQLAAELRAAVTRSLSQRRPLLHHLNADTSWLLQIPRPTGIRHHRRWFNVLIDPWLAGSQSDVASWFSQQEHATESSLKSIQEVEMLAREIELVTEEVHQPTRRKRKSNGDASRTNGTEEASLIDVVAVSHEFTDHCHKATLLEVHPDVPVVATVKAAQLIRGWKHFRIVVDTPPFPASSSDWRDVSVSPLPDWLTIARLISDKDTLYYHSALMVVFAPDGQINADGSEAEAVIYTPHGINAADLRVVADAQPPIRTLAFLHGLHDIKMAPGQQLNLGAHNGLQAQRLLDARYWISTHDEVKHGRGIVSWLLTRKTITLKQALEEERARLDSQVEVTRDWDDVRFVELRNGESAVLA